ncbi:protein-L-isoaspartate O-methyltransferase [Mesoterricola sediminis]|uniref:Protein-L-isoaspartate O-methyltransferase n=2 Tax=Mesoterricola sediminis TaxID=2927980 RepID=A0AA48KEU7_9BACT|nr:protein-L-isoaspartate O-methyltransferase [Mesoterricola sediminis]
MIAEQIRDRGVADPRVLAAMAAVPRHAFLEPALAGLAYADRPLPLGFGQTISQPYIVAFMAEALGLRGGERVLEVGSGCGYMAAVLARLAGSVHGIELEAALVARACRTLAALGGPPVTLRCGDGRFGWPEAAPFDAILASCAAEAIPAAWWDQLAPAGRILLPLERSGRQDLVLARRGPEGPRYLALLPVAFVPLRAPA